MVSQGLYDHLGNLLQQRRLRPYSHRTGIWIYTKIASSALSPSTVSATLIEASISLLTPFALKLLNGYFGTDACAVTTSAGADACSILEKGNCTLLKQELSCSDLPIKTQMSIFLLWTSIKLRAEKLTVIKDSRCHMLVTQNIPEVYSPSQSIFTYNLFYFLSVDFLTSTWCLPLWKDFPRK